MRVVKDADVRKSEILDVADELFSLKGYEKTTISDIIEVVGVARGTLYYHFNSKEEIMEALVERYNAKLVRRAKKFADDKTLPVLERLFKTLTAIHTVDASSIHAGLHLPESALMHQKMEQTMLAYIPPLLSEIVEEGVKEGLFHTPYPLETVEMIIAHVNTVFDSNYIDGLSETQRITRIKAFIQNMDRLLGAEEGTFAPIIQLFDMDELPE